MSEEQRGRETLSGDLEKLETDNGSTGYHLLPNGSAGALLVSTKRQIR